MTILDKIFEQKKRRVAEARALTDLDELIRLALDARMSSPARGFRDALLATGSINIIAEFKKASPSKGSINNTLSPAETSREYEEAGARAISVLTEEDFFQGSLDDLRQVREATSLPVLRKDFIFDEFQIYEAAAAGADAILLIVAALDRGQLSRLQRVAQDELRMGVLVEVHTRDEMKVAREIGATLIGVNNRDLRSFAVSLDVSRNLASAAPPGVTLVSESGITSREQMLELRSIGYSAFLVGETLMRGESPGQSLRNLINEPQGAELL